MPKPKEETTCKLKPCPFCGGPGRLFCCVQPDGTPTWEVDCENEDCAVSACTDLVESREKAAAIWNRRAE